MKFKKTPKQREQSKVLASEVVHFCCYGGSRSGKTFGLVRAIVIRALKCRSKHLIVRKHFNSCKRTIFKKTLPDVMRICFPDINFQVNRTDFIITFTNGSEIHIGGLDNDKSAEKILGDEFSTIFFNEISELDYGSVQIVLSRLAEDSMLVNKAFYDMNPPSKSHWSYWLFIKKLNPEDDTPLEDAEEYEYLLMNPVDNMENIDKNYIKKILEKMPEKKRQRFLMGEFTDDSEGQAYYAFSRERHVTGFSRFNTPIMFGMDFNVNPMTCIIFQVCNGVMYVLDEIWLPNSDTFKMVDELHRRGYKGGTIFPDSTGKNRKTSGKSDFDILREAGFTIKSVNNPLQRDRVNNVNRLFTSDQIIINNKCKKLRADLEKVSWKDNKLHEGKDKQMTHISDCLGYPAWNLFPMNRVLSKISSEAR